MVQFQQGNYGKLTNFQSRTKSSKKLEKLLKYGLDILKTVPNLIAKNFYRQEVNQQ